MSTGDIDDRLNAAADKAEDASEILRQVANNPVGSYIATDSGPVPSVKEWFAQNEIALGGVSGLKEYNEDLQDSSDPTKGAFGIARALVRVSSVSELLSAKRDSSVLVQVQGYHAGSRRGGGRPRYWDPSMAKANHNGGTVIDPDKAFPADWSVLANVQSWFTPSASGLGCWVSLDNGGVFLPTEFGAKGDGITNDQPAYNACAVAGGAGAHIIFTPTASAYRMHWFFGYDNQRVTAYGARIDLFKLATGPTVLAASGSNSRYDGVWLNCLETNLPNVRCTFEDRSNSHWYKCRFEGFRDAAVPDLNNAWGAYFKRATNITLELCQFENNSQNDIAILEGSTGIDVISAYGSALNINIEPNNDTLPIRGVTISNSLITKLLIQENSFVGNSGNNILVQSCDIVAAYYDGGGADFQACRIRSLNPMPDAVGRCYAGSLSLGGSVTIGQNLIRDPNFVSVSATDPGSSWQVYTGTVSPSARYAGISTNIGRGLRLNPGNASGTCSIRSESIPVVAGAKYLAVALTGANYPVGAGQIGIQFGVRWLNSSQVDISNTICPLNRATVPTAGTGPTSAPVTLQSAVVVAPAGAAFAQILVGSTLSSATTSSSDWYSAGLHPITEGASGNTHIDHLYQHKAQRGNLIGVGASVPSTSPTQYYYRDYLVGDRIITPSPAAGGFDGSVCTTAGTAGVAGAPGTWNRYGAIQA